MQLLKICNSYIFRFIFILFIISIKQITVVYADSSPQLPELPVINSKQLGNNIEHGNINESTPNITQIPNTPNISNSVPEVKNGAIPKVIDVNPPVKNNNLSDKNAVFTPWNANKNQIVNNKQKDKETSTSSQTQEKSVVKSNDTTETITKLPEKLLEDASKLTDKIKSVAKTNGQTTEPKTKQKEMDSFLKQELLTILDDVTIPYDLSPIYFDDKTLTDEERKRLKDKIKTIVNNVEGANLINKLLMVNYKVAKPFKFTATKENRHLPKIINPSQYRDMAFEAIEQGNMGGVRALLSKDISINLSNKNGETLLIYAALMGQIDLVRLLLAKGANVNAVDSKGYTALHIAVLNNDYNIAKALIVMGANKSIRDYAGKTPLDYITTDSNPSLSQLLS